MRVFVDINVLASALASGGLCVELFGSMLTGHELLTSDKALLEPGEAVGMPVISLRCFWGLNRLGQ